MEKENETLPDRLLRKRDYVRDVVLKLYEEIGPAGFFAVNCVINPAIRAADEALKNHDAVEMISALRALEDIKE